MNEFQREINYHDELMNDDDTDRWSWWWWWCVWFNFKIKASLFNL